MKNTEATVDRPALPWWRVGMLWLVLAGPVAVIAAGIATALIAVRSADTVVRLPQQTASGAYEPAQKARNHAAAPLPR